MRLEDKEGQERTRAQFSTSVSPVAAVLSDRARYTEPPQRGLDYS